MTIRLRLAVLGLVAFGGACTCDPLPIDSHKYACVTDAECGPDLSCIAGVCGGMAPADSFGVRLSIGLEDTADLIADLDQALNAMGAQ